MPLVAAGAKRVLMVGDPCQLPPISILGKERAMFVRLVAAGLRPIMLRTQYRLHPSMSRIPNELFYGGSLIDGIEPSARPPLVDDLQQVTLIDFAGGQTTHSVGRNGRGVSNDDEASIIVSIIMDLLSKGIHRSSIGVITFYRFQLGKLEKAIDAAASQTARTVDRVMVSTIDAAQGCERDIIILSTCRTSIGSSVEAQKHLASPERACVALTRARHHLIIVGHSGVLRSIPLWSRALRHVQQRLPSSAVRKDIPRSEIPAPRKKRQMMKGRQRQEQEQKPKRAKKDV